jgi:hypothetical protein
MANIDYNGIRYEWLAGSTRSTVDLKVTDIASMRSAIAVRGVFKDSVDAMNEMRAKQYFDSIATTVQAVLYPQPAKASMAGLSLPLLAAAAGAAYWFFIRKK